MNILLIASLYKPYSLGGAEVVFGSIVDELKKEHTVSILTTAPWNGFHSLTPTKTEEDGVTVYRFYPLNIFSFIALFMNKPIVLRLVWHCIDMFNLHSYCVARSIISQTRPDVVMTHNLKGIGYTIPAAIRFCKVAHAHTVQDLQLIYPVGTLLFGQEKAFINTNVLVRLYGVLNRWLFGSPSIAVFASQFLHDFYLSRGFFKHSNIMILPNPIAATAQSDDGAPQDVRARDNKEEHGDEKRVITFSFFGQLEKHKGVLFLIDAFKQWKRDDVRLLIGSRGSLHSEVTRRIADDPRMQYLGFIEDLPTFLSSVDYAIMPSLCYENSPMITFENLAVGTPVIVSRIGGAAEPIQDGVNGFIFVPGDEQSFREALERAVAAVHDGAYQSLSSQARTCVRNYSLATYCEGLLQSLVREH